MKRRDLESPQGVEFYRGERFSRSLPHKKLIDKLFTKLMCSDRMATKEEPRVDDQAK